MNILKHKHVIFAPPPGCPTPAEIAERAEALRAKRTSHCLGSMRENGHVFPPGAEEWTVPEVRGG